MDFSKIIKSRTVWVIALTFVLAGFEGVRDFVPLAYQTPLFGLLGILAAYFRVNTRVDFEEK